MTTLFSLVVIATSVAFAFGCIYATWGVLTDLFAGWKHLSFRSVVPRRFGIGALFTLTAIIAIACALLDGVAAHGMAEWGALFAISLVWAAAIVYGFHCMMREFRGGWANPRHECRVEAKMVAQLESSDIGFVGPPTDADQSPELDRWLGERAGEDLPRGTRARDGCSTKETRSHFRVKSTAGPKGLRWPGFGRP
jgi:hypothetical protein